MSNDPQQWGPGPDGTDRPQYGGPPLGGPGGAYPSQGQNPNPQLSQPGPYGGPGGQGQPGQQGAYAQQPGGYGPSGVGGPQVPYGPGAPVGMPGPSGAYAPGAPVKKKSKLPLVLGIVAGVLVLAVLGVAILMNTVFKAPTVAAGRTSAIFDSPGVRVGTAALTGAKKATGTFGSSDDCSKRMSAAASGSDSVVEASDAAKASAIVGRTQDAAATDKVFDGLDAVLKNCSSNTLTMRQKGVNIGNANGVTYKEYVLEQPKSTAAPRIDLVLVKYGNTWGVFLGQANSIGAAKDIATSYGARVKAAAK